MMETKTAAAAPAATTEAKQKKRTTEVVKVKDEYIQYLLEQPPRRPFEYATVEYLRGCDPSSRDSIAEGIAHLMPLFEKRMAILQQYHDMGYAVEENEVRDDDE
jgi:hypothetical protein